MNEVVQAMNCHAWPLQTFAVDNFVEECAVDRMLCLQVPPHFLNLEAPATKKCGYKQEVRVIPDMYICCIYNN